MSSAPHMEGFRREVGAKPPLIVIFWPTGCGKSRLAVDLALSLNGEVVSADSRQIYRGLDIGTGKITENEMCGIPHYGLDLIEPGEVFTADRFAQYARGQIQEIAERGKVPILCGGTWLYIDATIYDIDVPRFESDPVYQTELETFRCEHGNLKLWERLHAVDPEYAAEIHPNSYPYVMRALEVWERTGKSKKAFRTVRTPLYTVDYRNPYDGNRPLLYDTINARVESMFRDGWVAEVTGLLAKWVPPDAPAMNSIGYREVVMHLQGELSLEATIERIQQLNRNYAKRQMTWGKRYSEFTKR